MSFKNLLRSLFNWQRDPSSLCPVVVLLVTMRTCYRVQCRVIKKGGEREGTRQIWRAKINKSTHDLINGKCRDNSALFPTIRSLNVLNTENSEHSRTGRKAFPDEYMGQKCKFTSNCVI